MRGRLPGRRKGFVAVKDGRGAGDRRFQCRQRAFFWIIWQKIFDVDLGFVFNGGLRPVGVFQNSGEGVR